MKDERGRGHREEMKKRKLGSVGEGGEGGISNKGL